MKTHMLAGSACLLLALAIGSTDALAQASRQGASAVTLIAAGDVEWSGRDLNERDTTRVVFDNGGKNLMEGGWFPIPRLLGTGEIARRRAAKDPLMVRIDSADRAEAIEAEGFPLGAAREKSGTYYGGLKTHGLKFNSTKEWARYPFLKIGPVLRSADIAFVNLETPLTDRPHIASGLFRTPTSFANGMKFGGVTVASIANNHSLDDERQGVIDTRDALVRVGILPVGGGKNLEEARQPVIIERKGIRFAFLAYTQYTNNGLQGFARPTNAGPVPMDPRIIKEDIRRVRNKVDYVILSLHWDTFKFDTTQQQDLHPDAVAFGHEMIDAGADVILGHHAHVPRAVEVYKGKPIYYCMANLIFSFGLPQWRDSHLARITFTKDAIQKAEVLPIAGRMKELAQPYLLTGERANAALVNLQEISKPLGTQLDIVGDTGVLRLR